MTTCPHGAVLFHKSVMYCAEKCSTKQSGEEQSEEQCSAMQCICKSLNVPIRTPDFGHLGTSLQAPLAMSVRPSGLSRGLTSAGFFSGPGT